MTTASLQNVAEKPKWRIPSTLVPLLVLIALCLIIGLINPRFFTLLNLKNLMRQSSILTILALGSTFIILMGCIDLSIEGVMAISGVVASFLVMNTRNANELGLLGVLIAVLLAVFMGFLNGVIHTKLRIPSFMATLGMWYIGLGLATWLFQGFAVKILDPMVLGWAKGFTGQIPNLFLFALAALVIAYIIQNYTRLGRYAYAIGGAEDRAALAGIPVDRYKIMTFTLAGLFYGIGGVLNVGRIGAGTSVVGEGTLFATLTAILVGGTSLAGGRGGVWQALLGAWIVTVISNGMTLVGIHNFIQIAVHGVIITVAVVLSYDRQKNPIIK